MGKYHVFIFENVLLLNNPDLKGFANENRIFK